MWPDMAACPGEPCHALRLWADWEPSPQLIDWPPQAWTLWPGHAPVSRETPLEYQLASLTLALALALALDLGPCPSPD